VDTSRTTSPGLILSRPRAQPRRCDSAVVL